MVLRMMRRNIAKFHWILWIVIASFILVYGYDFVQKRETPQGEALLIVNGREVPAIQIQRSYAAMSRFIQQQPQQKKLILDMIMESAVNHAILEDLADTLRVTVKDEEISERIREQLNSLKEQVRKESPDIAEDELERQVQAYWKNALFQQGYADFNEYRAEIAGDIRVEKVQELLAGPVPIAEEEVKEAFRREYVTAKIEYVDFLLGNYKAQEPDPSVLESYYRSHMNQYLGGERRKIRYFKVLLNGYKNQVKIPEEAVQRYYKEHTEDFQQPEKVHVQHILISNQNRTAEEALKLARELLERIHKGEKFDDIARLYSDDPGTKNKGGDLGWVERGRMVKNFENASFALRPNAVVGPIETEFGYHLIKVLEKDPGGIEPLNKVRETILEKLIEPEAKKLAELQADKLASLLNGKSQTPDPKTLQDPGRVELIETDFFDQFQDDIPLYVRQQAFTLKKPGEWSKKVTLEDGFAVIQLVEIRPPEPSPYEKVQDKVRRDWEQNEKMRLAHEDAKKVYDEAIRLNHDLKNASKNFGYETKTAGPFPENGPVPGLALDSNWSRNLWKKPMYTVFPPELVSHSGYFVYRIIERQNFDSRKYQEKAEIVRVNLINQRRQLLIQSLLKKLKEKAEIKKNDKLIQQLFDISGV